MVPHLTTSLTGPLQELERQMLAQRPEIERWLRTQFLQEGIYTFENVEGAVAEPVIYMIDQFVVGGFYRVHTERDIDENVNSPGAKFVPLAFETDCHTPDCSGKPGDPPNRFYTYGVVSRLAMLAAAAEVEELVEGDNALGVRAANA